MDVQNQEFILVDFPKVECLTSSCLITFGWKSILLAIWMANPNCFLKPFSWNNFFILLPWDSVCLCYWDVILKCSKILGLVRVIQSLFLCVLIGKLILLIFSSIKEKWLLLPHMFVLYVALCNCGYLLLALFLDA